MTFGQRVRTSLDVFATVATISACATVIWIVFTGSAGSASPPSRTPARIPPLPTEPVSLQGTTRVGNPTAKIVLIEYSDFQCPYCARAALETLPPVLDKYVKSGKVQVVFRHLPLDRIHPFAQKAAEAAECAGQAGKFWEMHDVLFGNREKLDVQNLRGHAATIGLDRSRFDRCLESGEMAAKVRRDAEDARKLQITGTPTFLLGTLESGDRAKLLRRLTGAMLKTLEESLQTLLSERGT